MKRTVLALLSLALAVPAPALAGPCGSKAKKTTSILGIDLGVLAHTGELVPYPEVSATVSTVYWFLYPTALRGRLIDSATFTVTVDQVGGNFHTSFGALGGDGRWYGYGETLRQAMLLGQAPSARLDYVQLPKGKSPARTWPTGPLQTTLDLGTGGFAAVAFYPLQTNVFLRFRADTGTLKLTHCAR